MRSIKCNLSGACTSDLVTADTDSVLEYNNNRVGGLIQNLHTTPLYVHLGAAVNTGDGEFTYILAGGAALNDGTGGSFTFEGWLGPVSIKAASGSPRCNVVEFTA